MAMGKSGQQMRDWLEKHQLSEWAPDETVQRVLGLQHSLYSSAPCSGRTSPGALRDAGWTPVLPFPVGFRQISLMTEFLVPWETSMGAGRGKGSDSTKIQSLLNLNLFQLSL